MLIYCQCADRERGMHHSKGEADALNLKINKVCKENIIYLDALSVETIEVETWEKKGRKR